MALGITVDGFLHAFQGWMVFMLTIALPLNLYIAWYDSQQGGR